MQNQYTQETNVAQLGRGVELTPTNQPHVFRVQLRLPHKTVHPGTLDLGGEGRFKCRRQPEHILRKLNAWGVNAEIVDRFPIKWISIICEGVEYITSREFIRRFGKRLTYREYEQQYILPLDLWGLDVVREFEKKESAKPTQLSLFGRVA
jgi:hypothetical protein